MSSNPAAGASIVASLSLESINPDLYRSKILWCPTGARGVFGGQVIGQALVAATATIGTVVSKDGKKVEAKDEGWGLHSQHCYFILP
jgi:acyl-CoA thioesterase 8